MLADFEVQGRPPGVDLADLAEPVTDAVYEIALDVPWLPTDDAVLWIEVRDHQGNEHRVERRVWRESGT